MSRASPARTTGSTTSRPGLWGAREGGFTFVMVPEMARHLYDFGFKTKDEVYEWLYKQSFSRSRSTATAPGPTTRAPTAGWASRRTSGKPWKELPDDYMVPLVDEPFENCIIVAGGHEEASVQIGGGHGPVYSIDVWR